jgi:GNAT superfamily N-acetyltransferase
MRKHDTQTRFVPYEPRFHAAILDLHRSAIADPHPGMDAQADECDLHEIDRVYFHSGGEFLIGLQDGEPVAMGGLKPLSAERAELKRMRVAPHLQGRGIGSQLLVQLERRARLRGFREVCLETAQSRPLTLAFYTNHGYVMTGNSRYGCVETVTFAKQIGPDG